MAPDGAQHRIWRKDVLEPLHTCVTAAPRPADNMAQSVMGMFWAAAIAAAISCVFLGGGYRRHPWLDPLLPYLQQQLTGESVARLNPAGAGSNAVDGGGME